MAIHNKLDMAAWYKNGLAWRSFIDLTILMVAFYMPLVREWTHWSIAENISFVTIHAWILRTDLRAFTNCDHTGMFMMTYEQCLMYKYSIAAGWFIDLNAVAFQVWHLSSTWSGEQDDVTEQRIQLALFCFKLFTTGIRTVYFAVIYTADPSKFNLHPKIIAEVAYNVANNTPPKQPTKLVRKKKTYTKVPTQEGEASDVDNVSGELMALMSSQSPHLRGNARAGILQSNQF